ncbi:MAG: FAD:protein FMN transferase [Melioribacteraceae bacterium]|nr:FAD:protein FMN transferase [Melioribacteraceae bacterium]MCF8266042.1 FAD:protein FMN transferase [Melioribacteraceae bacterium]MCF8413969.1 FAD:protein FMN transferase [Melioribacteraceae bacterium]
MINQYQNFTVTNNISTFSHHAMNTIFQLFISHADKKYAEQAAFEVFKEIDNLEDTLSRYRPNSDISKINNLSPGESFVLSEDSINCITESIKMYDLTNGIFDISLGPVIQCWKENSESNFGDVPSTMHSLLMDPVSFKIVVKDRITLDLGGIGKGYAAEKSSEILNDWQIDNFLLNCGNSTIKIGNQFEGKIHWPITITNPQTKEILSDKIISNGSISSSGLQKGNHIINPITQKPVSNNRIACWVHCENAVQSDALSTAFMILEENRIHEISRTDSELSVLILENDGTSDKLIRIGDFFNSSP